MSNPRIVQKIGSGLVALFLLPRLVFAGNVQFSAQVDQKQISIQDTISLTFIVKSENSLRVNEPEFNAPDFRVVNQFSSISVNSQYDSNSNRFSMINTQQLTKVLKPLKKGALKIDKIRLEAGGSVLTAPNITIQVVAAGALPNQPMQPMQPGRPMQPGGPGVQRRIQGSNALVIAEVEQKSAYKGEQVVVSYYLYHQMRIFNVHVEKFPILNGFLREDLEVPAMGHQLTSEPTTLNGVAYERSLLARYAAYPLQEGKLSLDSMSLKYSYYSANQDGMGDEEDPFFGFFQQLAPKTASAKSEKIVLDILPLPEVGKPASFGGGIGVYELSSAVDRYEVRANEAVTLTVKVEGKGNVTSIQAPKVQWPNSVELYDTNVKVKSGSGRLGIGEKVFEFLLIPREPGKFDLPAIEFSFFDPQKKEYYSKKTEPVQLNVLDPAPGSTVVQPKKEVAQDEAKTLSPSQKTPESVTQGEDVRYLKSPAENSGGLDWKVISQIVFGILALSFGFGLWLITKEFFKTRRRVSQNTESHLRDRVQKMEELQKLAMEATQGAALKSVTGAYEILTEVILSSLEDRFHVGVRSISRDELEELLIKEKGLSERLWKKTAAILEFADLVRFASSAGGVSEVTLRNELKKWVAECESVLRLLENEPKERNTAPASSDSVEVYPG